MKHAALTRSQAERSYFLEDDPDIGKTAFRFYEYECLECRLGFIYTLNGSSSKFIQETLKLILENTECLWPATNENSDGDEVD